MKLTKSLSQTKMKTKNISRDEFLKALFKHTRCYMKKPRSWQKVWFWWEIDKENPKEFWFMNIAISTRQGIQNSSFIISKDVDSRLDLMESKGYKYYIDE